MYRVPSIPARFRRPRGRQTGHSATRITGLKAASPGSSKHTWNAVASTGWRNALAHVSRGVSISCRRRCHPAGLRSNPTHPCRRTWRKVARANCARAGQNWLISWMPESTTCLAYMVIPAPPHPPNCTARTRFERLKQGGQATRRRRRDLPQLKHPSCGPDRRRALRSRLTNGRHQPATGHGRGIRTDAHKEESDPILRITTKAA